MSATQCKVPRVRFFFGMMWLNTGMDGEGWEVSFDGVVERRCSTKRGVEERRGKRMR